MAAIKHVFAGRPIRCPLHPALVHLPIALFPISVLLDLASHACPWGDLYLVRGAFLTLVSGIVTGLVAAIFGLVDYTEIRRDHPAKKIATRHLVLNVVATVLFGISAVLRLGTLDAGQTGWGSLGFSIVGLVVLAYAGYLGGALVYGDGVAVGRHRRKTSLPRETIMIAPGDQPLVEVGADQSLAESATLRVNIGGVVAVIARLDGKLYAFQEFCPHRFGPLSEGALKNCEVTCPWHNSRFDVRTGKVTHGPAQVDLRTFHVESRAGRIWIEAPRGGS